MLSITRLGSKLIGLECIMPCNMSIITFLSQLYIISSRTLLSVLTHTVFLYCFLHTLLVPIQTTVEEYVLEAI
jgi:hypothetical protein